MIDVLKDVIAAWNQVDKHRACIIGGDLNICAYANKNNTLTKGLEALGFHQQITQATHEKGNIIDHCYYRKATIKYTNHEYSQQPYIELQPVYWSDHDSITVLIAKCNANVTPEKNQ